MTDLYARELEGYRTLHIPTVNRAGNRVTEIVWLNFAPPARYHDTRYVGRNRRERERIKRRVAHWSQGLTRMQTAERQAVFEALSDTFRSLTQEEPRP
jgi:hypothetical protein